MAFPVGWTHRAPIVIQQSVITGATTLTGFPVLLTQANLPADFLDSDLFQADGGDLRFSSDEAGASPLPLEVVSFAGHATPASATCELWVRVASVSPTVNTTIYAWRKSGAGETQPAATDAAGRNAVWDGCAGVWHGNSTTDSTGNGNTLSAGGNAALNNATAKIGTAFTFDGSGDYYNAGSGASLDNLAALTLRAWLRPTSLPGADTVLIGKGGQGQGWHIGAGDGAGGLYVATRYPGYASRGGAFMATNTWASWAFRWNGQETFSAANVDLFENGAQDGTWEGENFGGAQQDDAALNFVIGRGTAATGAGFAGQIDEVQLWESALSNDWLQAAYANENSPSTFAVAGAVSALATASPRFYAQIFG